MLEVDSRGWLRVGTDSEMRKEDFGRCLTECGSGNPKETG